MPSRLCAQFDDAFKQYTLHNPKIEAFFAENYVLKVSYKHDECANGNRSLVRTATIAYVYEGLLRVYQKSCAGKTVFTGFTEAGSTLFDSGSGIQGLGKTSYAMLPTTIYIAPFDAYLDFLTHNEDVLLHQVSEPYYRRNLNTLLLRATTHTSPQLQVAGWVLFLALRFGMPNEAHPERYLVPYPPTNDDAADFLNISVSTVSKCMAELSRNAIIDRSHDFLVISDINALDAKIADLENAVAR